MISTMIYKKIKNFTQENSILEGKWQKTEGIIFDIKRMSINDGPGIRTTVFLKGCNMSCKWCHNPEGKNINVEFMYNSTKCIKCGVCEEVCEREVHRFINSKHLIDRNKCNVCGKCIEFCPENAVEICGKIISTKEVIEVVKRDKIFYDNSGGGMTISGGEPLIQRKFTLSLLFGAKLAGINTIIDTNGHWDWNDIKEILPYTDRFRYDIKIMNNDIHKLYTGVDNKLILENLRKLTGTNKDIVVTIPLIKDINDSVENITSIVLFLKSLHRIPKVQILPYHSLYISKLKKLERSSTLFSTPGNKDIEKIEKIFTSEGIEIYNN